MNTVMPLRCRKASLQLSHPQRGVILLFSLIALTIMLIGAVALISSFNTSLVTAGNIGFKRDLANQAEHALKQVMAEFSTGVLVTVPARGASISTSNYSAIVLNTNALGIPLDLLKKDAAFATAGWTLSKDVTPTGSNARIRYLVDRLCQTAGNSSTASPQIPCVRGGLGTNMPDTGDESRMRTRAEQSGAGVAAAVPEPVVYRVTMRVMGPRNTEAFYQATFTEPLPPPAALPP